MSAGIESHRSIIQTVLDTELLHGFFCQFQKLMEGHSYISYSILDGGMSRKKRVGLNWGVILREYRKAAGLSQDQMGLIIGYSPDSRPGGNVGDIEKGKLPISEDKLRLWVTACNKNMFDFYKRAGKLELGIFLITEKES